MIAFPLFFFFFSKTDEKRFIFSHFFSAVVDDYDSEAEVAVERERGLEC